MTEGKKVQTDPTTRKYTAPDVPYTTDIQGQGPARVFSMTHVSEEEAPVRPWGGDSYVTDDGDDSAENGVLAGGGDCRVIDK